MTEELTALLARLTCGRCLGNGHLGGRAALSMGGAIFYRDDGHGCPSCSGTGVWLAEGVSVLAIGSDAGQREVLFEVDNRAY